MRILLWTVFSVALLAAADPALFTINNTVSCGAQGCMGEIIQGDTYIFGGWSHTGSTRIDDAKVPGTIFGTLNDGVTKPCVAAYTGGNVSVIKLTRIDMDNPSNTSMSTVNCMGGGGINGTQDWGPAARGTCTQGFVLGCTWKSLGITHVDGKLYLQIFRQEGPTRFRGHDSTLLLSENEGATWVNPAHVGQKPRADGDFPAGPGDASYPASIMWPSPDPRDPGKQNMARLGFVHYCQDETIGCPDIDGNKTYVYALSNSGTFSGYVLARVSKSNLPHLNASEWEYYRCLSVDTVCDGMEQENWTSQRSEATAPIGSIPGADAQTIWAAGQQQYLSSGFDGKGHLILATAPHIWGPWKQHAMLSPGNGSETFNNLLLPTYRSTSPGYASVILVNNNYTLKPAGTLYLYQMGFRWPEAHKQAQ